MLAQFFTMQLPRSSAFLTALKRGVALLPCFALLPLACDGQPEAGSSDSNPAGGTTSAGGSSNSGGETSAGGTTSNSGGSTNEGGSAGEGGDSGARVCGCTEGDYFIEMTIEGETTRFTEPGAPSSIYHCDLLSSPAFFGGGTCLPHAVAACNEEGDCLTIARTLTLVAADGELLLERETPRSTISVDDKPRSWRTGRLVTGSFVVEEPEDGAHGGTASRAEVTGTFSLCTAGFDLCAK